MLLDIEFTKRKLRKKTQNITFNFKLVSVLILCDTIFVLVGHSG